MPANILKILALSGLLFSGLVLAERPTNLQPLPEPPAAPDQVQDGEAIPLGEPQITIIQRGQNLVHEYRLNGHLYAVKVTPDNGIPYYLIDADGDGHMEGHFFDGSGKRLVTPQWVLFRW